MPTAETAKDCSTHQDQDDLRIALPEPGIRLEQDSEWCLVETPEGWREFRFHDYGDLYQIPGLYERIFYEILECSSPSTIRRILQKGAKSEHVRLSDLRVLDLGAGNGMVGEQLADAGVPTIVGVDIVEAAREATERDRPGIYDDYLVTDMTALPGEHRRMLESYRFNCLTCVAALGFGDIPPLAFAEAYRLIETGGMIAFNIKDVFLEKRDGSGFAHLISRMIKGDMLSVTHETRYQHRLATNGDSLHYMAIVGRKVADIPAELVEQAEEAA